MFSVSVTPLLFFCLSLYPVDCRDKLNFFISLCNSNSTVIY